MTCPVPPYQKSIKRTSELPKPFKALIPEEWKIMHDFVHLMDKLIDEGQPWDYRITYKIP